MERVAFLLEDTHERIGCLLNPESLVVRRQAGVRPRRSLGGPLTGSGLADDPLLYTGGGRTEITLELLFDVSIAGSLLKAEAPLTHPRGAVVAPPAPPEDVRALTAPLWKLAENSVQEEGYGRPPRARFVWGKSWNIPGVVEAVTERFEYFTSSGVPRRSWLKMRFIRLQEPSVNNQETQPRPLPDLSPEDVPAEELLVHQVIGAGAQGEADCTSGERMDQIAHEYLGHSSFWRFLARFNRLDDPCIHTGEPLLIPPLGPLR